MPRTFTREELIASRGEPMATGTMMASGSGFFVEGAIGRDLILPSGGDGWMVWDCFGVADDVTGLYTKLRSLLREGGRPQAEAARLHERVMSVQSLHDAFACVAVEALQNDGTRRFEVLNTCIRHGI